MWNTWRKIFLHHLWEEQRGDFVVELSSDQLSVKSETWLEMHIYKRKSNETMMLHAYIHQSGTTRNWNDSDAMDQLTTKEILLTRTLAMLHCFILQKLWTCLHQVISQEQCIFLMAKRRMWEPQSSMMCFCSCLSNFWRLPAREKHKLPATCPK